ncbi:MAG: ATP-binding protein [Pseudomonadota bacterium]
MADLLAKAMIAAMKTPLMLIGAEDRVILQNEAMTDLLKIDFKGRHYITALRQPATIDAVVEAKTDQVAKSARYLVRVENTDRIFEVSAIPVDDHIVISFEDQTAVEETQSLRRDFVANVSHELRTPLTALLGFIETLQGPARDDPAAQERFLAIMATEADRLRRLVDDLLSLSRVEEVERSRPVEPVDLGTIVRQATELLGPLAEEAGTQLIVKVSDDAPLVPGDDAQLQQVLNNLIENAIKYGASDKGITVEVHQPAFETTVHQQAIRLTVTDCGQGIPAHHLIRLTERFYRVDLHRSRQQGGTGLGLAIVKHIANRHRGKLLFESVEGEGTTVTLMLPTEVT